MLFIKAFGQKQKCGRKSWGRRRNTQKKITMNNEDGSEWVCVPGASVCGAFGRVWECSQTTKTRRDELLREHWSERWNNSYRFHLRQCTRFQPSNFFIRVCACSLALILNYVVIVRLLRHIRWHIAIQCLSAPNSCRRFAGVNCIRVASDSIEHFRKYILIFLVVE